MARYRKIKIYGNTFVIQLSKLDMEDLGLIVGDEIDIEDIVTKKTKQTRGKNGK